MTDLEERPFTQDDPERIALAWTAGLFEGEGSISFHKARRPELRRGFEYRLRLSISNCERRLLEKAQSVIGGSIYGYDDEHPRHRTSYRLDIKTKELQRVLPRLIPFIVGRKKEMAEIVLAAANLQRGKSWRNWQGSVVSDLEILYRRSLTYRTFKSSPPKKEMEEWGFVVLRDEDALVATPPYTPRVLNIKDFGGQFPPGAVYVARPTKWGNRFIIGKHGTRAEVIAKYREWLFATPDLLAQVCELRRLDLVCFCAPLSCHADILLELANAPEGSR